MKDYVVKLTGISQITQQLLQERVNIYKVLV